MRELISMLMQTAPLIHTAPTPGGWLKRMKYCLRGLAIAPCTSEWFDLLQRPEMALIVRRSPALFHKLQRPYLNRALPVRRRLAMLAEHYQFVTAHFPEALRQQIYDGPGLLLADLNPPELPALQLRLRNSRHDKEGDFSVELLLRDADQPVFILTFSIVEYNDAVREIHIGGLQGHKSADKELVIALTRAHYGLRPKALVFFALQQLAAVWQINRMRGISDAMHIYQHYQKRRKVASCYDEFWSDCGGVAAADGLFDLPVAAVPREISTIKPNKRQMYRRRYAMLAEVGDLIQSSFRTEIPAETAQKHPPGPPSPARPTRKCEWPVEDVLAGVP